MKLARKFWDEEQEVPLFFDNETMLHRESTAPGSRPDKMLLSGRCPVSLGTLARFCEKRLEMFISDKHGEWR